MRYLVTGLIAALLVSIPHTAPAIAADGKSGAFAVINAAASFATVTVYTVSSDGRIAVGDKVRLAVYLNDKVYKPPKGFGGGYTVPDSIRCWMQHFYQTISNTCCACMVRVGRMQKVARF